MSASADKKRGYEERARDALAENPPNFAGASKHLRLAAKLAIDLAEQQDGATWRTSAREAEELIQMARRYMEKAQVLPEEDEEEKDEESSRWQLIQKTGVNWEDVKGLYEAKKMVIDRVINPMKRPELADIYKIRAGGGLLLYGPPGNGKTMFAKALANEIDAVFMNVSAANLKNKYVGESERAVVSMFEEARKHSRCVLFLDEAESILRKRGNQRIATVEQFLAESDGVKEASKDHCLLILLASNRPWLIDSAALRPGRIGVHAYVDLPVDEARKAIIEAQIEGVPIGEDFDLNNLVEKTEGLTCAEIGADNDSVCSLAFEAAYGRAMGQSEAPLDGEPVLMSDFENALGRIDPYKKQYPDEMKIFEDWKGDGSSTDESGPGDDNEE